MNLTEAAIVIWEEMYRTIPPLTRDRLDAGEMRPGEIENLLGHIVRHAVVEAAQRQRRADIIRAHQK